MDKIKKINVGGVDYEISTPNEQKLTEDIASVKRSYVKSVNGNTGAVTISKTSIGLGAVTNDAQVKRAEMGTASGVATLDKAGKVPASQLPSYVDDVFEVSTYQDLPKEGAEGKIYVVVDTGKIYRWSGTTYVVISETLAIGTTSSTAFAGNRGLAIENKLKDGVVNSVAGRTGNVTLTKKDVGLANVDDTADSRKNVLYATTAGSAKASDVYAWAKAANKPTYSTSEITGLSAALDKKANTEDVDSTVTRLEASINSKLDTSVANTLLAKKLNKGTASKVSMSVASETLTITITTV